MKGSSPFARTVVVPVNATSAPEALPFLKTFDDIAVRNDIALLSIGQVLPPQKYQDGIGEWAATVAKNTKKISFNLSISSHQLGIHGSSIKAASEIITSLSEIDNGEANFRFTAIANCPANTPFFPAAFHEGINSFGIGLETPNLLIEAFQKSNPSNAREV